MYFPVSALLIEFMILSNNIRIQNELLLAVWIRKIRTE